MKIWILAFVFTGAFMLALDAVWLSTMPSRFYRPLIGELLAADFRLAPAIVFYFLYVSGIVFFAVRPALAEQSAMTALVHGALLGLLAYGTYDLTNQATLKVWPTIVTVVDLAWGAFLTAGAATAGYLGVRWAAP